MINKSNDVTRPPTMSQSSNRWDTVTYTRVSTGSRMYARAEPPAHDPELCRRLPTAATLTAIQMLLIDRICSALLMAGKTELYIEVKHLSYQEISFGAYAVQRYDAWVYLYRIQSLKIRMNSHVSTKCRPNFRTMHSTLIQHQNISHPLLGKVVPL